MITWEEAVREAKFSLGYDEDEWISDWDEVVEEAKDILSESGKIESTQNHKLYLKSEEWKVKRGKVLFRDNYKCRLCGQNATQVHHQKYDSLHTPDEEKDCISVCEPCHSKVHGRIKK